MGLSARIVFVITTFLLLFFITKPSFAQENLATTNTAIPNTLHNYSQKAMIEVMSAMICQIAGVDIVNQNQPCLGIDSNTKKIGYVKSNGGAIGAMGNFIAGTFLVPVHVSDYIAYEVNNFGLVKKTYAQTAAGCDPSSNGKYGVGFCGLTPVLSLFTLFRNMSYILFVIVFVVIGVAIMLRVRIDPRTVMTIQNQIPKLIIGLVMITLAYAIAGFLIDLMWITVYFIINTLSPAGQAGTVAGWTINTPLNFIGNLFNVSSPGFNGGGVGAIAGEAANSINGLISDLVKSLGIGGFDCAPWNLACNIGNGFAGFLGWLGGVIAFLIFLIAIFVQLFKLWFALLKCFINVLLAVILAPFWILAGLLPGASPSVGWGGWIRNLAGNLAPFPAILFLFLIGRTIVSNILNSTQVSFSPPLLGNVNGSGQADIYGALIAFGFIVSAPSIVEQVRKVFRGAEVGGGIGGIGAGSAAIGYLAGRVGGRLYYRGRNSAGEIIENGPLAKAKQRAQVRVGSLAKRALRIPQKPSAGIIAAEETKIAQKEQSNRED